MEERHQNWFVKNERLGSAICKGNSSIKQFCSWDFTERSCRIRNTHLTFVLGQGLPSVLCNHKSNNTVHDHLAASCEDHERNILSAVCFPIPTWGECSMCSLPPASIHGVSVIEFPMRQISFCREKKGLFCPLLSSHKKGKSSVSTNKKNLSSKLTNFTSANLGALDMCQSKFSNYWFSKADFDIVLQEIPCSTSQGK